MRINLNQLKLQLEGELFFDELFKAIYATDASVYRQLPLAIAYPKNKKDIQILINFANNNNTSLIPRTAGTSLSGQCVGEGIIVDVSKYFNKIVHFDLIEKTVTVEPGVVRDVLNIFLKPHGLFFGPNTSTSNRCMIGGMVGNNSSGTTSIKYGVTRDKVIKLETILSDGSEVIFEALTSDAFQNKRHLPTLEGEIYRTIYQQLHSKEVQNQIKDNFPKAQIHRRNTGYAIDQLIDCQEFDQSSFKPFNMCELLSGSEGTLAFTTQITLKLDDLPPIEQAIIALHFKSIEDCMNAVTTVMQHDLYSCEMMDDTILNLTIHNKAQQENRFFIEGNPKAILLCELRSSSKEDLNIQINNFLNSVKNLNICYAFPVLMGEAIDSAFELRKAGLGLLGNIIGDNKTVACIEDTAVAVEDLAGYIREFTALMATYNQNAVYYAHAGAGELHLRPILNLKEKKDVQLFRKITTDVAKLVKKYQGSMSGEHGDGIVRSEFIPLMIGESNYKILKAVKTAFDPNNIFNPGKIVDPIPMDINLRYSSEIKHPEIKTLLSFDNSQGILREAEKCNGSGDCRKLPEFGGTMCPSYRATRNEKDSTRARANALREILTHSTETNRFNNEALKEVFDLCLSCKACASECPSSVDVAALKAEFQYQYQKENGVPFRAKLFAYNNAINKYLSKAPSVSNFILSNRTSSSIIKKFSGIASERSLPLVSSKSLNKIYQNIEIQNNIKFIKTVFLFNDEFTNYLDGDIGSDVIELLLRLNYQVKIVSNAESGRAMLSKGLLEQAKKLANKNVSIFKDIITETKPLIGIEPSSILSFRDDYLRLVDDKVSAQKIAKNAFLVEEFIQKEIELGNIKSEQFHQESKTIKIHTHCYQKAIANQLSTFQILNLPANYKVTIIPSGCCGMAGSFGYEKEHYKISMQIGEQTLFPAVRKASEDTIIAANGTSCRHQILDGTGKVAVHPATILREALV
ncbi:FAD-binding and (Fe-S)-binding domain-containing protein [Paucihalobacter sp.]|uniref:FAD-binding and (Fe-S)-binding domain-containing protein n=1 Tax=Paucihalobacter sp. TaxID=2850405 RepID=UPI003D1612D4